MTGYVLTSHSFMHTVYSCCSLTTEDFGSFVRFLCVRVFQGNVLILELSFGFNRGSLTWPWSLRCPQCYCRGAAKLLSDNVV